MRAFAALGLAIALAGAPDAHAQPAPARIIQVQVQGDAAIITIDRGVDQGVSAGWRGHLVQATGALVAHGDLTIVAVTNRQCRAKVKVDPELLLRGDLRVILEPPPDRGR